MDDSFEILDPSEEEKNDLSHRGQAARAMLELMRTRWFA